MSKRYSLLVTTGLILFAGIAAFTQTDKLHGLEPVRANDLSSWHKLGNATWRVENGEILGTPSSGGGWLVLNKSFQDVRVNASFRCSGECETGVLLRAEKAADGLKGVYVSLKEGDVATYRITLDSNGRETNRTKLRPGGGQMRIAPPPTSEKAATGRPDPLTPPPGVTLPISRPKTGLKAGEWNEIEVVLDANIIRPFLNEGLTAGGVADDDAGRFGPVALRASGGEVRFKNITYTDLGGKVLPNEQISSHFRMQQISDFYYAWSAAAADFNRDGVLDIAAGPYYYVGPDYNVAKEIYLAQTTNPSTEYPNDCMDNFAYDFTGDGWPDVLNIGSIGQPAHLYVNPKGESRRWDKYDVAPHVQNEVALVSDIDGDGKPELVYGGEGYLRYAKPDPANPTKGWTVTTISPKGPWGAGHGLGVGDINGDKRIDIVEAYGWWEQPKEKSGVLWTYHPEAFGVWTGHASPGGAEMGIYDVNGDGLTDVVTALQAHGYGLAWFEQKREGGGKIFFVKHMIAEGPGGKNAGDVVFSEPHGSTFGDVDGDGILDFIVGKRFWSHRDDFTDQDPYGPPVLYGYRVQRDSKLPGGAEFVPELVHNRSGAGNEVLAVDLNKDKAVDIVTSTDRGTFIFWGQPHASWKKSR
jgi:hypothetical protein